MKEVRVCRFCGNISPLGTRGRCTTCNLFFGFKMMSQEEAEKVARRRWRRLLCYRLVRFGLVLTLCGSFVLWVLAAYFDTGLNPPRATTGLNVDLGPNSWAQVRRTPQSTGYTPSSAPTPDRVKWTYPTSQPLYAAPAVATPHLYLATMASQVVALDERTGQPVWIYRTQGPSSSTPVVIDQTVIVAVRTGHVVALNRHSRALQWESTLEGSILASPIVANGTVYIGTSDHKLYALDAATGQQRWAFNTEAWVVAAAVHAGDRVLVTMQNSRLYGVGAETGRRRFLYETGLGRQVMSSVAIAGERAYFGDRRGRVWAIDWQETTYPLERGLLFWQTNLFIWGMLEKPPIQKGSLWSRRVGGSITLAPAIAHGTVYVASSRGEVVALDASTGQKQWETALKVNLTAAPTVAATTVLVGTEAGVVGLRADTGEHLWAFNTEQKINASPIVAGNTIYAVADNGTLYAIVGRTE